jgi:hypothetical protein
MARNLITAAIGLLLTASAHAACSPQALADLRARGASAAMITQMCGGASGATQQATVCVTQFGVCPFRGVPAVACTCSGQLGTFSGTSR